MNYQHGFFEGLVHGFCGNKTDENYQEILLKPVGMQLHNIIVSYISENSHFALKSRLFPGTLGVVSHEQI
jgi:hypothetical protein